MDIWNLFWQGNANPAEPALALGDQGNTLALDAPVRAAILWPSLFTPEYLTPGKPLQLLIGTDDPRLESAADRSRWVVKCLRATRGLDPGKLYGRTERRLIKSESAVTMKTVTAISLVSAEHYAEHRVAGVIHHDRLAHFTGLYWITVDPGGVQWPNAADGPTVPAALAFDSAQPFTEWEDELLTETLDRLSGKGIEFRKHFKPNGRAWFTRDGRPICGYHPVVQMPKAGRANHRYLHLTDMHLSSRQDILRQSPARVIEAMPETPTVGSRVVSYRKNFRSALAAKASAILIGGDLMDHAHSAWNKNQASTPQAVWSQVGISKPDESDAGYRKVYADNAFVDLIDAFEEVLWIYAEKKIGVFGITGNHDCYKKAYGISPRVGWEISGLHKANPGIPLDHNLTFIEATLAFGRSYGQVDPAMLTTAWSKSPNFTPALLEWFYTVFTGFSSFLTEGPAGPIAGLGWGGSEQLWANITLDDQADDSSVWGSGFLPRATDFPTHDQTALLQLAGTGTSRRSAILMHPPVASYHWAIPENSAGGDEPIPVDGGRLNKRHMGTFTLDRRRTHELLTRPGIAAVIAGHSHRRAEYSIGPERTTVEPFAAAPLVIDPDGSWHDPTRVPTAIEYMVRMATGSLTRSEPWFVVSSSAGPVARRNATNIFGPWGSERPGGTVLTFESATGRLVDVSPVFAEGCKPRGCAALDYLQHMEEAAERRALTALRVSYSLQACPSSVSISLQLNPALLRAGLKVTAAVCSGLAIPYLDWRRMEADSPQLAPFRFRLELENGPQPRPHRECALAGDTDEPGGWFNFRYMDADGEDGVRWRDAESPWMALSFEVDDKSKSAKAEELRLYDWSDPWTIELEPKPMSKSILIPREVPEFNYRDTLYHLQYQSTQAADAPLVIDSDGSSHPAAVRL